ncbi:MAG: phosphoribosylformylglycinamidine synthase subunit PurS [Candidatus Bathyarchaeota archaeon]|nr:MAG: phosphoribosylformylglycinamidine synthase subunit PurS [Candidatus Bathyarchaeota archaeon]
MEISLKPGHSDPEGETTARSLRELAYPVKSVTISKLYVILLEDDSKKNAERKAEEICKRLLANPTKDNYSYKVEKAQ